VPGFYDLWTVSLSYAIAALSGFAAFESVRHARNRGHRALWATIGGVALGFGIWSMHFVGMLAWVPPFPLFYSVSTTTLSMAAVVLASIVAIHLAVAPEIPSRFRQLLATLFIAAGICAMHYIGMTAVHFNHPPLWSAPWLAASCLIALAASYAALCLLIRSDREGFKIRHQTAAALVIGLAICGMHYTGMRAMLLWPNSFALRFPGDASGFTLARIGVSNALIFIFCLLAIAYHDRLRLARTAQESHNRAQAAARIAEQMSAAGRIAASIAHEVNNPLAAVTNLLYLAEHSDIGPTSLGYLQQAQTELQRVSEITTHTLKFYRQQHAAALACLPELVESVLVLFGKKLQTQHIAVHKDWPPDIPEILCLAGEIRQVIANLIGNAIDSMPHGGTLTISVRTGASTVELTVRDTGQGIPEEAREKLFQPFFTTKGTSGTGLGLSISAEILERHHGTLRFDTSTAPPNQGTTFNMILPREPLPRATA
jgi:signal transduction histidine kinase